MPVPVSREMIEAVASIFGRKEDKRSVGNLVKMLSLFYDKKELTPMQVIKRMSLSSSTAYDMIGHLKPLYLEKIRDKPSKRGPFRTNPVYRMTPNAVLLYGFLLKKKHLILEALGSGEGNPLYRLSVAVYEKVPNELIFDAVHKMLRMKNVSVEVFFDALVGEYSSKLTPAQSEEIRMDLELAYRTFAPYEQEIVFEYMREKLKHDYYLKLRGKDLRNYHAETQRHPKEIVYICQTCSKTIMTTSNPFETRIICPNCSTATRA